MAHAQPLASTLAHPAQLSSTEPATLACPYFAVPNHLLDALLERSSPAFRLYMALYRHSWGYKRRHCRLTSARLQELIRGSVNTVRAAGRELVAAGLIRQGSTTPRGTLYVVEVPPEPARSTRSPEQLQDYAEARALSQPIALDLAVPEEIPAVAEILQEEAVEQSTPAADPTPAPLIPEGSAGDPQGDQNLIPPYDLEKQGKNTTHTARVVAPQAGELPWSSLTPSIIAGLCQAFSALAVVRAILTVWFAYRKQPGEVRRPAALLRECLSGRGGWQFLSDTEIGDWLYSAARTLQRRTRIDSTGVWTDPLRAEVDALVDWLTEHRGGSLEGLFQAYPVLCPTLAGPERCSLYWLLSTCGGA